MKRLVSALLGRSRALDVLRGAASAADLVLKRTAAFPRGERGGLVVMFHGVKEAPSPYDLALSSADFDAFCAHVADAHEVLPLDDLEERRKAGRLPACAIALTFDDGYADNHDVAWPILRRYGLPATVFVTTSAIRSASEAAPPPRALWFRKLAHAIRTADPPSLPVAAGPFMFTLDTEGERVATVGRVAAELKKKTTAERDALLDEICAALGVSDFEPVHREMLTWDQVRAMDAGGFSVAPHTVTHPILGRESADAVAREIGASKEEIEAQIRRKVTCFAYPNGKDEDMNDTVIRAVDRAGFRAAYTAEFGAVSPKNDPFRLPRITTYAASIAEQALDLERFFYATA